MRSTLLRLSLLILLMAPLSASAFVTIDWLPVGDPGNACDVQPQGCFGSVFQEFIIAKHEVTNAQYVEFLNAVAVTDTNGLYDSGMAMANSFGGIIQSGSSGSHTYAVIPGRASRPINRVDIFDTMRFVNWLANGQPTGPQDSSTTEDGTYTMTPSGIANNTIVRNPSAEVFIPLENEWYKAAYYDVETATYFDYPYGTDSATTCAAASTGGANEANCGFLGTTPDLTSVGHYSSSIGPNGTFDQGGNVREWSESIFADHCRGNRGGSVTLFGGALETTWRDYSGATVASRDIGIRVAALPGFAPPIVPSLLPTMFIFLATLMSTIATLSIRRA